MLKQNELSKSEPTELATIKKLGEALRVKSVAEFTREEIAFWANLDDLDRFIAEGEASWPGHAEQVFHGTEQLIIERS